MKKQPILKYSFLTSFVVLLFSNDYFLSQLKISPAKKNGHRQYTSCCLLKNAFPRLAVAVDPINIKQVFIPALTVKYLKAFYSE